MTILQPLPMNAPDVGHPDGRYFVAKAADEVPGARCACAPSRPAIFLSVETKPESRTI
jgi:hypothetical protein